MSDIGELAARIEAHLAADEATATAAARKRRPPWRLEGEPGALGGRVSSSPPGASPAVLDRSVVASAVNGTVGAHVARFDPARAFRRVALTRELVASILADSHYSDESGYGSCSQDREPLWNGWTQVGEGPPGSGCSDPERAGKPCDCGRDARVARRLAIIAGEWETG